MRSYWNLICLNLVYSIPFHDLIIQLSFNHFVNPLSKYIRVMRCSKKTIFKDCSKERKYRR